MITGATAYFVDVLVFNLALLVIGTDHVSAKAVSSVAAITVAYLGSRYYTWPDQPPGGRHPVLAFVALSAAAAGVQLACLWVSHDLIGWTSPIADNASANVVGMGLATVVRFYGFRSLVFGNSAGEGDGVQHLPVLVDGPDVQAVDLSHQFDEVPGRGAHRGEGLATSRA